MILRLSLILLFFSVQLFGISVLVSKEAIGYEERLSHTKMRLMNISSIKKACKPLTLNQIKKNDFITTRFINKNTILCTKDVKIYKNESVVFNFGGIEIEQKGKVLKDNQNFIEIKKIDGKKTKIFKDGRIK